jgi:adenosylcobyric acid synthase
VLDGRPAGTLHSRDFLEGRHRLWASVTRSLGVLREEFHLVIAEGAGSPSEPNLKATDIVNMGLVRHAGASVLIVGDIDRGGVFAHLVGTLELLAADERRSCAAS